MPRGAKGGLVRWAYCREKLSDSEPGPAPPTPERYDCADSERTVPSPAPVACGGRSASGEASGGAPASHAVHHSLARTRPTLRRLDGSLVKMSVTHSVHAEPS